MNDFESWSNEQIKQCLYDMFAKHNSYLAQIQHLSTPMNLRENFKNLDAELNKKFVQLANYFYRRNDLRYSSAPGVWDKIREH